MAHGMEVECSVLGDADPEASVPGEIAIEAEWYDYEAKYQPGGMELIVPARLPGEVREEIRRLAVEVFRRVGCAGMARCDFFVEDPDGDPRVLVNELNTIPGFTETSVYARLFEESGLPYPKLLDRLLRIGLERHERESKYRS
jgi:D-alanine-D-alanine ligase